MAAQIIDGNAIAKKIKHDLKQQISDLQSQGKRPPGLAVILVGEDPASHVYVGCKHKACLELGITSKIHQLPANTTQATLLQLLQQLNLDDQVDGILVQLPLPQHIHVPTILENIAIHKDVDGFHPYNLGRLAQGQPTFRPCTPAGIMLLLEAINCRIAGQHATIIGTSNIVGRPMLLELLIAEATITTCHKLTKNLDEIIAQSDIVISATGVPELIKAKWLKPGCTVIDVGFHRSHKSNKIIGDVEFTAACQRAAWITPVPGGVGPMTIAVLLKNTLQAYTA